MTSIGNISAASNRNPGIVPPWLDQTPPAKNPGIVPPYLQYPVKILPVELPEYHILPVDESYLAVNGETQFVPVSVDVSPTSLADALRGR